MHKTLTKKTEQSPGHSQRYLLIPWISEAARGDIRGKKAKSGAHKRNMSLDEM